MAIGNRTRDLVYRTDLIMVGRVGEVEKRDTLVEDGSLDHWIIACMESYHG